MVGKTTRISLKCYFKNHNTTLLPPPTTFLPPSTTFLPPSTTFLPPAYHYNVMFQFFVQIKTRVMLTLLLFFFYNFLILFLHKRSFFYCNLFQLQIIFMQKVSIFFHVFLNWDRNEFNL